MVATNLVIEIRCPASEVYAFLMDLHNYPLWQAGLIKVNSTNGMRIGSNISFVVNGLGQKFTMRAMVTDNNNRSSFTVVAKQGPITFESSYRVQAVPEGCRLELSNKIDPGHVFRMAEGVLQSISEARYEGDLRTLKALLEGSNNMVESGV
jgi:uncharacterized membrane protein